MREFLLLLLITVGAIAAVIWAVRLNATSYRSLVFKSMAGILFAMLPILAPMADLTLHARKPIAAQTDSGGPPTGRRRKKWVLLRRPVQRARRYRILVRK